MRVATYNRTPVTSPTVMETPGATSGDHAIGPITSATTPIVASTGVIVVHTFRPRATSDQAMTSATNPRTITATSMATGGTLPWRRTPR
jgi:hypothetical protein